MKFHPDDEDDDDDSSSVIDVEFLNESTLEILAAQNPSALTTGGATNDPPTNGTLNVKPAPESNDAKSPKPEGTQQRQVQETVRIILGDSITRWRDRSLPQPRTDSSHVLVWKQTTGTTSMVWQNSRLRVDDGSQEPCLQAENGSSYVPKEMIEPETSSTFVEAVGIWDDSQQAYRLEIPQRIAIDLMPSNRQNQSQLVEPGLAGVDPWTQAKQADETLRKRKQERPNTIVKRPSKRGTATFMRSSKR